MAKKGRPHRACPMLIMSLLWIFIFAFVSSTSRMLHAEELDLLWSFKSSVNDPLQHLSNWNPSVTFCEWQGIICTNNSSRVIAIQLSAKNFSGKASFSVFQLPYIESIDLSSNQLAGEIPRDVFFSSGSSLRYLNLSNNNFTGSIPRGSIPRLEILDLSNNLLAGGIPEEIGSFSSVNVLDLGGNALVGKIPLSIANMTSLQFFTLASNQLVGEIPPQIGRMRSLKWIYLGYNSFSGEIPKEIGELTSLNHLDLVYNNLTGQISPFFGNLSNLQHLFLYHNNLTGSIPKSIFGLTKLISLDLSDNSLSGEIPELVIQLQNLEILQLFSNNFTGKIPSALSSLPRLQVLQLWSNHFSGEIPKGLGKQNNLTVLDLSTNFLTGKIPEGLCGSGNLFKLILFSNSLQGEIPVSLSTCKSLQRIRLQDNKLSGELPSEFTKLPLVYFLDISRNDFSGRIDGRKWEMTSLKMLNLARNRFFGSLPYSFGSDKLENLDMSSNGFSSAIPHTFGNFSELMQLKLSENELSGPIPEELSSCNQLVSLDLSHNQLSGQIPNGFSTMPVLGQLDLSQNQLSGEVPTSLGGMASLVQVNISHNRFHGNLPSTGAFLAINASAVVGNDLCSGDATSGLPSCRRAKSPAAWWFVAACILAGLLMLLVFVALGVVFLCKRNHLELERVEKENGVWELQLFQPNLTKSITIEDVFSSTKKQNVLCRDKEGVSYTGRSIVNDMQFVVKEMNDVNSIPPSLWPKIIEFGRLEHPNIVKLLGICRSNKDAYLVYEHVEGKYLSEVLRSLSWERRRKIAIGIAKALRFLHCHRSPSILAGCVSPGEVIIDRKDEPHLRLSLPHLLCANARSLISAYVAPETKETNDISEKSDIYGFGLLLIELLTGKVPDDAEFGVHESIVEWARYCYSDCHLDSWVDPTIKGEMSSDHNGAIEAMSLAIQCTATDPMARPCANDISKNLEFTFKSKSCVSSLKFSLP